MEKEPLYIAHKGDTVHHPENTIEAFGTAFDLGADGIELDVHLSERGEIIVVHDYLYDRAKKYPTLDDVLLRFANRGRIEIEVKELEEKALQMIKTTVDRYRPFDVEVTTGVAPLAAKIGEVFPSDRRGLIFRNWLIEDWMPEEFRIKWILSHMQLSNATVLHMDTDLYTPAIVEALQSRGLATHTHLKKDQNGKLQTIKDLGIDQFTFDDIMLLRQKG